MGKLLRIDLSKGKISRDELNSGWSKEYIGARGLGARYLFEEQTGDVIPLSAENAFIIMTGPFTGTAIPAGQRIEVITKSALTNTYLCSSVGGDFGRELKLAGWDGIIIKGKAETPVFLWINDERVEIRSARQFWGKYSDETQIVVKEEVGDKKAKVACIGPAGERLVKLASLQCETRSAGRGGPGAILGYKNLKAVAVRGTKEVEVKYPDELNSYIKDLYEAIRTNPILGRDRPKYGTMEFTTTVGVTGVLPYRNFQSVFLESDIDRIGYDPESWRAQWVVKDTACHFCPIMCGKISEVKKGPYKNIAVEGPDYETAVMFGPNCGNTQMDATIAANYWCDKFGLDTMSTGSTIGFAMECYERGIITKADTGGIDLTFGNSEAMVKFVEKIANREGLGDLLAEGTKNAARKLGRGSEGFAMQSKGLEFSAYDPRGAWGMALGYATNVRGGAHNQVFTVFSELSGKYERFSIEKRAGLVREVQNMRAVYDSLQMCIFSSAVISIDSCTKLCSLVTGENVDATTLLLRGDKIYTLERGLNVRDGISRKDDYPPARILEEPLPNGPAEGKIIGHANYEKMLNEFYQIRGWDQNGRPKRRKLAELGMKDIADRIEF